MSSSYSNEYPHGVKDVPDSKPRTYFAEDPTRALEFGGSPDSEIPELKSALLRVKKTALGTDTFKPSLAGGETWYFGDGVSPKDIEIFQDGEWQPLVKK